MSFASSPHDDPRGDPHGAGQQHHPNGRKISEIVADLCNGDPEDRVSLHDLLHAFEIRAFGLLVLVFALPNGVPAPIAPGLSAILGAPLLWLGAQMLLGFEHPWFPRSWLQRSFRRADVARALRRAIPVIERIERFIKPRVQLIAGFRARRLIGALVLWNAFLLALPIPFGNLVPAWAIILTAVGQLERDGVMVASGFVTTLLGTAWVWFLITVGLDIIQKLF
ncbi:MAG TPA: exopolysaccharide biosynthesis protein [Ferrovibrio sp.]|uniref:exopolysaccharide biosynthesis protein n=1 Tax=Ferrovibrio sp. TaxID=1917215 RepID=UPI002ED1456E